DGYYDGLASLIENMVQQDFLSQPYRQLLTSATSVADLDSWLERHFGTAATTGEK
ncbi:MAG: hypothetical protein GY826_32645, partial [Fuerstiella sp.]|nr:hypothetical protein [Fuerstiella sp.]